jgi:hypothetical protein
MNQVKQIAQKLQVLREQDPHYQLFGSHQHTYVLNPCCTEVQLQSFERRYAVTLPHDYRAFVTTMGNGGAGPNYGLHALEDTIRATCWNDDPHYLSKPFPLNDGIDMFSSCAETADYAEYLRRQELDAAYAARVHACIEQFWEPRYSYGALNISDHGCGISSLLIVAGPEAGTMWIDDRGNQAGLFPELDADHPATRVGFLAWYERWLDQSLRHMADNPGVTIFHVDA